MHRYNNPFTLILFILLLPLLTFAQKPKQEVVQFQSWSFPEVVTSRTTIGIVIDERKLPVTLLSDPVDNEEGVVVFASGNIPLNTIEKLNFRTLNIVPVDEAELVLTLAALPAKFQTSSDRIPGPAAGDPPIGFTGALDYFYGMVCTLTDHTNNIIYQREFEGRTALIALDGFSSSQEARKVMKGKLWENLPNLMEEGDLARTNAVFYDFMPQIMQALDFQRLTKKLYLYGFNSKKDAELEKVNASIAEIEGIAAWDDDAEYDSRLRELLTSKIELWSTLTSKYDVSDKKQKKIVWGLLANICAAQYALGEYEAALNIYKKISQIDYRQDFTYLRELPERNIAMVKSYSKKSVGPIKDYRHIDYRATNDHRLVLFQNSEGLISDTALARDSGRRARAELLYSILALDAYYTELELLLKQFAERNRKSVVGYTSINPYLKGLIKRIASQAEALKGADLSAFPLNDKVLVTGIRDDMIFLLDRMRRELNALELANPSDVVDTELSVTIDTLIVLLTESFEKGRERSLEEDISTLMNSTLHVYNDALKKLPLIEFIIDEITSIDKLKYEDDPELYKRLFKRYKKHYANLFFNSSEFTRFMHHTERDRFTNIIRFSYQPLYKEKVENINANFADYADPDRAIDILYLFQKPEENLQP